MGVPSLPRSPSSQCSSFCYSSAFTFKSEQEVGFISHSLKKKKVGAQNVLTLCTYVYSLIIKHLQLIDKGHSLSLKLIDSTMEIGSLGYSLCDELF